MNLDEIRDALFKAMDDQLAVDTEAQATNYRLGQQKLMYNNDARGTLYSGQPTWERANLAANNTAALASLNNSYLKNKLNVWDNITNTLDQINSYNKAAAAMAKATSNVSSGTSTDTQSLLEFYNSLNGGS